ncbi:MAG: SCO family protein [Bdellovibrionales bacterium]|nr:SCO family protein [Bdellovibrionales bacterium]
MIYNFFLLILLNLFSLANASDLSVYNSTLPWKDDKNNDFVLSQSRGKKLLIAMAYTSCQGTCPMIISKLKKAEKLFLKNNIPVDVVIISFDPSIDIPAVSTEYYRNKMGIKKDNWHFLNGSENDTRKMSMLLGIRFAKNPISKAIVHDNKIILLNENGVIEKKLESLNDDEQNLFN